MGNNLNELCSVCDLFGSKVFRRQSPDQAHADIGRWYKHSSSIPIFSIWTFITLLFLFLSFHFPLPPTHACSQGGKPKSFTLIFKIADITILVKLSEVCVCVFIVSWRCVFKRVDNRRRCPWCGQTHQDQSYQDCIDWHCSCGIQCVDFVYTWRWNCQWS